MTTNVYIDVDGVINSFHVSRLAGWDGAWLEEKVIGYPIHWYTDLVDSLNKLSKREDVVFKWLTTWQDHAVTDLSPALSIEGQDWPVLRAKDQRDLYNMKDWWKLTAIKEDIEKDQPDKVVWIDDDFKYDTEAINYVKDAGNILAVSPFTDWGMTKEEFDGIIEFIGSE